MLTPLLDRFAEHFPIPTMARAVLESSFRREQLDQWFETVAQDQYTRRVLFATLFELMLQVVTRQPPSVHAAYQGARKAIPASSKAVYDTLNGLEPGGSAALVRYSAAHAGSVIDALEGARTPLLASYRIKILAGHALGAHEHRLAETRAHRAAPLPGKAWAVLEPALGLISQPIPEGDAYTQERAWLAQLDSTIEAGEQLPTPPLAPMCPVATTAQGQLSEPRVTLNVPNGGQRLEVRCIRLKSNTPTREGETTLYLLTTLPVTAANAAQVAALYRERWTLQTAFLHLTTERRCEFETLAYPPAALFGLAMAVVAYNAWAVVKAARRRVHGGETSDTPVSGDYLVNEMGRVGESLETLVAPEEWAMFHTLTPAALAAWLLATAQHVPTAQVRGPKNPAPPRTHDPTRPHVSVARLLVQRQTGTRPEAFDTGSHEPARNVTFKAMASRSLWRRRHGYVIDFKFEINYVNI